jgi:hypothetical protein
MRWQAASRRTRRNGGIGIASAERFAEQGA